MSHNTIIDFMQKEACTLSLAGGKGANLATLAQAGFHVPKGFIVSVKAYEEFMRGIKIPSFEYNNLVMLEEQSLAFQELLKKNPLNQEILYELRTHLDRFPSNHSFSVRSSSNLEDLSSAAFAGAHDTFLHCMGIELIAEKIKACYLSLWNIRAIAYRHKLGFPQAAAQMAVVVQEMVQADKAGVSFCINPVDFKLDELLINANYGLGESVVGGEFDIDEYRVNKQNLELTKEYVANKERAIFSQGYCIAHKEEQKVLDSKQNTESGTQVCKLPSHLALAPCLSHEEIQHIAHASLEIQAHYGFPQDIEWAIVDTQLYILQSRPITTIRARWSRDESAERYPKAITPFTWDYVDYAFHISLEHSFKLLHLPPFQGKWFASFQHYIYGNQNAVDLYMGGSTAQVESLSSLLAILPNLLEKFKAARKLSLFWHKSLDSYLLALGDLNARDLSSYIKDQNLVAVWDFIQEIVRVGVEYFKPNIAISITQSMLYKNLFSLLMLLDKERAPDLFNALIATNATKTSLVNTELSMLAQLLKQECILEEELGTQDSMQLLNNTHFKQSVFYSKFCAFLDSHGHREVEFDAYVPTWGESPHIVLDTIMLLMHSAQQEKDDVSLMREKHAAKTFVFECIRAQAAHLGEKSREIECYINEFLELVEVYTILDDEEHYQTTRLTPLVRKGVRAFGEILKAKGALQLWDDVFFAHIQSLEEYVAHSDERNLARLVDEITTNKQSYLASMARVPAWNLDENGKEIEERECVQEIGADSLRGIGVSAGVVEGEVYRVHSSDDFAHFPLGAILVAQTTNPAWTPLFYSAKAVITQSGGALSHGAVTAREMKIPAVMAVKNVMQILKNGDKVRVDGGSGIVVRI